MNQGIYRLTVFAVVLTWLASAAVPALAFNPQPEPPGSVAIGLATGQTARIPWSTPPIASPASSPASVPWC